MAESVSRLRGYLAKSSVGPNCAGLTKIETITTSDWARAARTNDRCPRCSAPIVGTKPTRFPARWASLLRAVISAAEEMSCIGAINNDSSCDLLCHVRLSTANHPCEVSSRTEGEGSALQPIRDANEPVSEKRAEQIPRYARNDTSRGPSAPYREYAFNCFRRIMASSSALVSFGR